MDTDKQHRPAGNYNQLTVGAVIVYLMRPEQLPTNPEREWRGKVVKVYSSAARGGAVEVEFLEAGHEGLTELVYAEQVMKRSCSGILLSQKRRWRAHQMPTEVKRSPPLSC